MKMKSKIPLLALCWVLGTAPAWSANVNININVGAPVGVPIIFPEPPLFLAPVPLGFQVAVGVPYDLFRVDGRFYLFFDNVWHVGSGYNGPWQVVHHDHLPRGLRRQRLRDIRTYRDHEYVVYNRDKALYRGGSYRPERYDRDRDHDRGWDHRGENDREHSRKQNDYRDSDKRADRGHGNKHKKGGEGWK
ncbi:hypothetical protein [Malonomonas rubra]|uniref:hypothetical protein n=1 Tax=Malonomonas rubra TaxID=57040 RepID=UPI0026ED5BE1|nr:hypothetical protein [Malonomonas rubra]